MAQPCQGIHFFLKEGHQRCFLEDTSEETLIVAKYENPDVKEFGEPGFTETVRRLSMVAHLSTMCVVS